MSEVSVIEDGDSIQIRIPMQMRRRGGRKEIIVPDGLEDPQDPKPDYHEALVIAISRAHRWKELLDEGKYSSVADMARAFGMNRHHLSRMLRLTLLAPQVVEAVLDGREPDGFSLNKLVGHIDCLWKNQERHYGFSDTALS